MSITFSKSFVSRFVPLALACATLLEPIPAPLPYDCLISEMPSVSV